MTVQPAAVVETRGLTKRFPGILAVDDVDLEIRAGEVHVVAGENGAGKSTLMKLLSQVERPDAGEILVGGEAVEYHGPRHAQRLGIAMVHQEFALAPDLTVAENLVLGRETSRLGLIARGSEKSSARALLERVGLDIDPARKVAGLSVAAMQRVEIAKALAIEASVVIMDEPTATLTEREIEGLFEVVGQLTEQDIAVVFISHRLDEITRVADRLTVMRDGKVVDTLDRDRIDEREIVKLMVGREIDNLYPRPPSEVGDVVLRVSGIGRDDVLHDCSFEVRSGEILGFAGLVGAGRTELARAVFGADRARRGHGRARRRDAAHPRPPRRDRRRHRLRDRGPQGRRPGPRARRAAEHHAGRRARAAGLDRPGRRDAPRAEAGRSARHPHAVAQAPRRGAVGRQPAEGRRGQVAGDRRPRPASSTSPPAASTSAARPSCSGSSASWPPTAGPSSSSAPTRRS